MFGFAASSTLRLFSRYRLISLLIVLAVVFAAMDIQPARAATTWIVTSNADSGGTCPGASCTLRQAIASASSGDTITFSGVTSIVLISQLTINQNPLTIDGGGTVTLDGNNATRLFCMLSGTLNLDNLTLTHGNGNTSCGGDGDNAGGAVFILGGVANISGCTFTSNFGNDGGGAVADLSSSATVNISDSTFTSNSAGSGRFGGAVIELSSTTNISRSIFTSNSAGAAGAVFTEFGTVNISDSTFTSNSADRAAAIENDSTMNIGNSTFILNSTAGVRGAIYNNGGTMTISNSTLAANSAPNLAGGIVNAGTLTIAYSIVARSMTSATSTGANCDAIGTINVVGINLSDDNTCPGFTLSNQSAMLGSPTGSPQVVPPLSGSPAIDAATSCTFVSSGTNPLFANGATVTTDEIGQSRPSGAGCDLGAYEVLVTPPTLSKAFGSSSIALGNTTTLTFTLSNANATALHNVAFSDSLPNGMISSSVQTAPTNCGSPTFTGTGSTISLSSATVGSTACTFTVVVSPPSAAIYNNTTSPVTSTEASAGTAASATLQVYSQLTLGKSFSPAVIQSGGLSTLTFTISNPTGGFSTLSGLAFNDTLPGGLVVAASPAPTTTCNASSTPTLSAAGNAISLTGGSLSGAPESCTVTVVVRSNGSAIGTLTNTTSSLSSTETGDTGSVATATITVHSSGASNAASSFTQPAIPLCGLLNSSPLPYIRATVPDGTASINGIGANVYCGPLFKPEEYGVFDRTVIHAVEVFALTGTQPTLSVTKFNNPITICLQGLGAMLYRDANSVVGQKRTLVELPSYAQGGFTCASMPNAGTIILVAGTPTQTTNPTDSVPRETLDICMVTTKAILNLHESPDKASEVLDLVPYLMTLKATVRQGDFLQVVYGSNQGWLSAAYLSFDGYCGK